jgi:phosphoribosylformylglycinamidine synthase
MESFEVMVSESQERMLCVVEPGRVGDVLAVCERFEVGGAVIGQVTDTGTVRVLRGQEVLGEMPVVALVDDCPLYDLRPERPAGSIYPAPGASLSVDASPTESLLALLACPNLASRRPLFEHYDPIVQSRTVRRPESADAAVLAIRPLGSDAAGGPLPGIAVSIDCNGRRVAADPYRGTVATVLECAANLACVGAEPLGVTNNLNFGNPEKPHVAWQLESAVRGLGDACRALGAAIVGGNVSLYNESTSGPIYPTPVIGMVGALPDVHSAGRLGFVREGDAIALVGACSPALPASELAKLHGAPLPSELPELDLDAALAAIAAVRQAVRGGGIASAHDIAEGGLAVALAECCLAGGIGAEVSLGAFQADLQSLLFGEGPGGFLLSGPEDELRKIANAQVQIIGRAGGERLLVEGALEVTLAEMEQAHGALAGLFP